MGDEIRLVQIMTSQCFRFLAREAAFGSLACGHTDEGDGAQGDKSQLMKLSFAEVRVLVRSASPGVQVSLDTRPSPPPTSFTPTLERALREGFMPWD